MATIRSLTAATFDDRGAAVMFTTPLLTGCRVRKNYRNAYELLIPNLAENESTYVIPWANLKESVTLTVHDRMLCTEIGQLEEFSPLVVRRVERKVAASGLAGPANTQAAIDALAAEEAIQKAVSDLLREAASAAKVELDEEKDISGLSIAIAPFWHLAGKDPPTLRNSLEQLGPFRDSLYSWQEGAAPEQAAFAQICAEVADESLSVGLKLVAEFDSKIADVKGVVENFTDDSEMLRRLAMRSAWLLDGWDFVTKWWETAKPKSRYEQIDALVGIARILPRIPTKEFVSDRAGTHREFGAIRKKWVRMYQNWRTGEIDMELRSRIEAIKAEAA